MNSVVPEGSALGVLAAGLILAYAVWVDRRDLGVRAVLGILGTTVVVGLITTLPSYISVIGSFQPRAIGRFFLLYSLLSTAASFLPLYVAANWLGVIRRAAQVVA